MGINSHVVCLAITKPVAVIEIELVSGAILCGMILMLLR